MPADQLRVGDAERQQAVSALGDHFAAGRLDQDEYDTRVQAAYASRTRVDLQGLFGDLPEPARSGRCRQPGWQDGRVARDRRRPRPVLAGVPVFPVLLVLAVVASALRGSRSSRSCCSCGSGWAGASGAEPPASFRGEPSGWTSTSWWPGRPGWPRDRAGGARDRRRARVGQVDPGRAAGEALGPAAAWVPMDGFHLADAALDRLGLRSAKGVPDTFDGWGYLALLRRLAPRPATPCTRRTSSGPWSSRWPAASPSPPVRLVVTEGNYLLLDAEPWPLVRAALTEVWYSRSPSLRLERLVARHVAFGKAPAAARDWVAAVDEPNARLVAARRAAADLVVTYSWPAQWKATVGPLIPSWLPYVQPLPVK